MSNIIDKKQILREYIKHILILELSRIDKDSVRKATKMWALNADLYRDIFKKISSREKLKKVYNELLKRLTNKRRKEALTFFYRIRRDELDGVLVF